MAWNYIPGVWESRLDGNLLVGEETNDPKVFVIGTASQGNSEEVYRVRSLSTARKTFGTNGNLIRGMYETAIGGATNIRLFRIGATGAKLEFVGGGITIETIAKDDSTGTMYELFWDHSEGRLRIWRASDDTLVYDNNPSYPLNVTDLGEVAVSGSKVVGGTWTDIGSLASPVTLAGADGLGGGTGAVYTAGTDGLSLSRMEMWEALYKAYKLLEDQEVDVIVPMGVYLDDDNVMDMTAAEAVIVTPGSNAYPTAGSTTDALGMVRVEEYDGDFHFWWYFPSDPKDADDTLFTGDGGAQIYPSGIGSANATTGADGTALTFADFHEVNFAYQLANFCYTQSSNIIDVTGNIGVKPPNSYSPKDVSNWVGKLPVTSYNESTGQTIITTNGSGLLGNKFMAGRIGTSGVNGIPGFTINGVEGLFGGGFIGTDDGFLDGTQLTDDNDALVDIGQYINVVDAYVILSNSSQSGSYVATFAPTYAGYYSVLPVVEAPSNKTISTIRLPFRVSTYKVDLLSGCKYVHVHQKPKGYVISDSPTAARAESDYRRLQTVRIVKDVIDDIREVADPFLGGPLNDLLLSALETRIDQRLSEKVRDKVLTRYDKRLSATPSQQVMGQAVLELTLVPVWELRQLFIVVGLSKI